MGGWCKKKEGGSPIFHGKEKKGEVMKNHAFCSLFGGWFMVLFNVFNFSLIQFMKSVIAQVIFTQIM